MKKRTDMIAQGRKGKEPEEMKENFRNGEKVHICMEQRKQRGEGTGKKKEKKKEGKKHKENKRENDRTS
jgi:hypothetical protein